MGWRVTLGCLWLAGCTAPNALSPASASLGIASRAQGLGLSSTPWTQLGAAAGARFGTSAASAGDVNADGFDDLIVGAPDQAPVGGAWLYMGSAAGLEAAPAWAAPSDADNAAIGSAVAGAGDVNGDGYADVIVADRDWALEGRVEVFYGGVDGLPQAPSWTVRQEASLDPYARFGRAVASAGDVNGDGFDDVVIGSPLYTHDQPATGRFDLYFGSASGLSATPDFTSTRESINGGYNGFEDYGSLVAGVGDLNGDGFGDLVSAEQEQDAQLYIWLGGPTVPTLRVNQFNVPAGADIWAADAAGDVNGDGYDDLVWGDPFYRPGAQTHTLPYLPGVIDAGRAVVSFGGPSQLAAGPQWTGAVDQLVGWSVGGAGDMNGDGYADILVRHNDLGVGAVVELTLGGPTATAAAAAWSVDLPGVESGVVDSAGDVNGDGRPDVLVSGPSADDAGADAGAVWVFEGSGVWTAPATDTDLPSDTDVAADTDATADTDVPPDTDAPSDTDTGAVTARRGCALAPASPGLPVAMAAAACLWMVRRRRGAADRD